MKIGLYGIYGLYNFGCEAIVRGTYKFAKEIYPDAEIIYYSYNYNNDKEILSDLNITIKPIIQRAYFLFRIANKVLELLNINNRILLFAFKEIIEDVDLIISIGGDMYTIPKVVRKNRVYKYYNTLVDFCNTVIENGKDVIIYGASIGPFGNYNKAIDYYRYNLKKYKLIVCREESTIDYLNYLGINNTILLPDPAFLLTKNYVKETPKYIGINLSPLSLLEMYGEASIISLEKLASVLDAIYEQTGIDLLFIPHVISTQKSDNDLIFLEQLKSYMKPEYQNHVRFANYNRGFEGLKPDISKCFLIVSARMHCAINSVVESIPAIFLSYSQKSVGMCRYVYGSEEWVIGIDDIEKLLIGKILKMLKGRDEIARYLKIRNNTIKKHYLNDINMVKKILRD